MKKFGFGKKDDDGDDSNRTALFGHRKEKEDDNPYAKAPNAPDPYGADATSNYASMTPYQRVRADIANGQRPGLPSGPGNGLPSGPRPGGYGVPPPAYSPAPGGGAPPAANSYGQDRYGAAPPNGGGYGQDRSGALAPPSGGYGSDRYGASGGYGGNRFDNNASAFRANQNSVSGAGPRGPSGYGGLGRTNSNDSDANRNQLFSGAGERYNQRQNEPPVSQDGFGQNGGAGTTGSAGYGEHRQLTAEEEEEEALRDIKAEKKQTNVASEQSIDRSVALAEQMVAHAEHSMANLGGQSERLYNTERYLDIAQSQNRLAEEKTKELKSANGSMFRPHVKNPFTANQRRAARDAQVLEQHRSERDQREQTRRDGYAANQRMEETFRNADGAPKSWAVQSSAAERSKYAYDNDSSDDERERRLDEKLKVLGNTTGRAYYLAKAIGKEVDAQNETIDRIGIKSDAVDDQVRMNRERLARIK